MNLDLITSSFEKSTIPEWNLLQCIRWNTYQDLILYCKHLRYGTRLNKDIELNVKTCLRQAETGDFWNATISRFLIKLFMYLSTMDDEEFSKAENVMRCSRPWGY